jgi:hypothetical protein
VISLDKVFIAITHGDKTTWLRADQIVSITEHKGSVLVKVAYNDLWIESDEPPMTILNRLVELANR